MEAAFAETLRAHEERFREQMDDDFNTPGAIGVLFDLTREVNSYLADHPQASRESLREATAVYDRLAGDILGILPFSGESEGAELGPFVDLLVETRASLREAKEWALADQIRERLEALGVTLEDTSQGTRWDYR